MNTINIKKGDFVTLKYEDSDEQQVDKIEYDEKYDEYLITTIKGSTIHSDYVNLIDYRGFVLEVGERIRKELPIDRQLLIELSKKYNTPLL